MPETAYVFLIARNRKKKTTIQKKIRARCKFPCNWNLCAYLLWMAHSFFQSRKKTQAFIEWSADLNWEADSAPGTPFKRVSSFNPILPIEPLVNPMRCLLFLTYCGVFNNIPRTSGACINRKRFQSGFLSLNIPIEICVCTWIGQR